MGSVTGAGVGVLGGEATGLGVDGAEVGVVALGAGVLLAICFCAAGAGTGAGVWAAGGLYDGACDIG